MAMTTMIVGEESYIAIVHPFIWLFTPLIFILYSDTDKMQMNNVLV